MTKDTKVAIKSAQTLAALRAASSKETSLHIRCDDYLAKNFLSLKYKLMTGIWPKSLLKGIINRISPGSYFFTVIRTKHFDNILKSALKQGIEQLVILGAGYDSRALRFKDQLASIPVFEIDFPGTQEYKLKVLRKEFPKLPSNITFIPFDFNQGSFVDVLCASGFSKEKATLFLWEGVSYYLPEIVVSGVLDFVGKLGEGSSIVFDYALRSFVEGDHSTFGGKQVAEWLKKINEPFLFGLNSYEIANFLAKSNLSLISDYGAKDLEVLYLKYADGKFAGKTLGHVRMAHAMVLNNAKKN